MIKNPFAGFNLSNPFGTDAMKRSRNLFGVHTTPRDWKHGARDIPFGMGAASLYVDGTDGDDSNDGESWITAKKTIQDAIDAADPWTQIFVKAGTYAENVTITDDSIHLMGQSRDTVIIHPSTVGTALDIDGDDVYISNFSIVAIGNRVCSSIAGDRCTFDTVKISGGNSAGGLVFTNSFESVVTRLYTVSDLPDAIVAYGLSSKMQLHHNVIKLASGNYGIYLSALSEAKVFENNISSMTYGIYLSSTAADNTIFHNNFIGTTLRNSSYVNTFFENYISGHTNINNGFGIATEPYSFTNGTDLRPVIVHSGWNSISILRSLLRKKTAAQTSQAATDANGTAWVDLKTIAPTTSDIELHRLKMTTAGSWAGTAKYRIIIGTTKVYPFPADKDIDTGVLEDLIFPVNVQINETCKIQFRSDNAGDGAGETVALNQLDYATVL